MAIEPVFKIEGMQEAMQNMEDMLPTLDGVKKAKARRAILNSALKPGTDEIVNAAKILVAKQSTALQIALGNRIQGIKRLRRKNGAKAGRGVFAGRQVAPIRDNPSAMVHYADYYGRTSVLESGIRHGHLIEFGTVHHAAKPFMVPAMFAKAPALRRMFAADLNKTIRRRLKAAKRKNKVKRSRSKKAPAKLVLRIK